MINLLISILFLILSVAKSFAIQTGANFDYFGGNVGIGTTTPQGALTVTNGNVGIGTWVPTQRMDVIGTVKATVFVGDGSGITGAGDPNGWASSGSNIYLATATNNIGLGTTTPQGSFVVTNGNVGLGTWSPSALLQINRPSSSPFVVTNTGNVGLGTIDPQGAWVITSGNVGIGTWAPLALFQVNAPNNNPFVVTAGGNTGVGTTTPQAKFVAMGNVGIGTWTATGGNLIINAGGNVGIGTAWPGTTLDINGGLRTASGSAVTYFLTNVGINSTGPGKELDVNGTVRATSFLGDGSLLSNVPNTSGGWNLSGTNVYVVTSTNNVGIGTTTPQTKLAFISGNIGIGTWTAAGGALIIRGGGNVGISTAWPGTELDVQGTVRASYFIGDGAGLSNVAAGGGDGWTPAGTNVYLATATTNVGIGTTTPQAKLVVLSGNVGIGTWTAGGALIVQGGNVGIGTILVPSTLSVKGSVSQIVISNTDAATVTTNAALGNYFRWTAAQNFTLGNPSNGVDGQKVVWEIIQDGTGSRTMTLDTKFALGLDISTVVLTTAPGKRDFITAIYNSSTDKWYIVGLLKGY